MGRRGEDNAATTGMLWVSGRATNGQFISCPLEQQVSCISAAGRVICVTLEDGGVQFIDLTATDEDGQPQFVARTWGAPGEESSGQVLASRTCLASGSYGIMLSSAGEVFSWGGTLLTLEQTSCLSSSNEPVCCCHITCG
jgi:hypothetical protein